MDVETAVEKRVYEIMTTPAVACRGKAYFEEAAELLSERDISGMPVVDGQGHVVGVVSERDLAHALGGPMVRLALRRPNHMPFHEKVGDMPRSSRRIKDVMTAPAICIAGEASLHDAARLMAIHEINRLPVVDGDRLIGIVTRGDVLGAIAHLPRKTGDVGPTVLVGSEGLGDARDVAHLET
jgi:CBS domain-containing protein